MGRLCGFTVAWMSSLGLGCRHGVRLLLLYLTGENGDWKDSDGDTILTGEEENQEVKWDVCLGRHKYWCCNGALMFDFSLHGL